MGLLKIVQTLSTELSKRFTLSWSHYVTLLSIDNPEERRFYEIEAAQNQWSVRELDRQIASSLYERLALSRDKEEVRWLASEGQVIEKASDLIKNPLVAGVLPKPSIEKIQQIVSVKSTEHAEISQTLSAKLAFLASVDEIPAIRPTASD